MGDLEAEVPLVKSYVAKFAGQAVADNIVNLCELSEPMENGAHYPLFLLCLQQLNKLQDKEWIAKAFNDSKIDLQSMLPGELQCRCDSVQFPPPVSLSKRR